jgi:Dolichyl-phosphate-mannose-protein mannosyltransferase
VSADEQFRKSTLPVFWVGALLRIVLAVVNLQANDNHIEVIIAIADENRIPAKEEMWEAFQPKLYHVTVAALWKILPSQALPVRIRMAQLISCAAGILTLILVLRFLRGQNKISAKVRCLACALVALNPSLIGISAQATNDSFVILFASLSLYSGYQFFEHQRIRDFSWMTICAILASLSKGNGLVIFMAITGVFTIAFIRGQNGYWMPRGQTALYGVIFLMGFVTVVARAGPYWDHYRRYGTPFAIPILPAPFPKVFERTLVYKPGVTSIVDALLTFRFVDLLRNPISTTDAEQYPRHRTSLWSQLYGRAHFAHFDDWPPSWRLSTLTWQWARDLGRNLGRLIFLYAIFPTLLLVVALWRQLVATIRWLGNARQSQVRLGEWLLHLAAFGYVAFIVVYALRYRDYAVMKAIFILPGLLGLLTLFARECDAFYRRFADPKAVRLCADMMLISLLVLYTVDILILIGQLGFQW